MAERDAQARESQRVHREVSNDLTRLATDGEQASPWTSFSRRAADEVRGDYLCTPDMLSPRGEGPQNDTWINIDYVERLQARLELERDRAAQAEEGRLIAENALNLALEEQEQIEVKMAAHRAELQQRVVEQLDELTQQQQTVSELTLALGELQCELEAVRAQKVELSARIQRKDEELRRCGMFAVLHACCRIQCSCAKC